MRKFTALWAIIVFFLVGCSTVSLRAPSVTATPEIVVDKLEHFETRVIGHTQEFDSKTPTCSDYKGKTTPIGQNNCTIIYWNDKTGKDSESVSVFYEPNTLYRTTSANATSVGNTMVVHQKGSDLLSVPLPVFMRDQLIYDPNSQVLVLKSGSKQWLLVLGVIEIGASITSTAKSPTDVEIPGSSPENGNDALSNKSAPADNNPLTKLKNTISSVDETFAAIDQIGQSPVLKWILADPMRALAVSLIVLVLAVTVFSKIVTAIFTTIFTFARKHTLTTVVISVILLILIFGNGSP